MNKNLLYILLGVGGLYLLTRKKEKATAYSPLESRPQDTAPAQEIRFNQGGGSATQSPIETSLPYLLGDAGNRPEGV